MKLKRFLNISLIASLFTSLILSFSPANPARAAGTLYVVPGGFSGGTCASWAWDEACTLTYALSIAASGDQIWVKAGVYTPTNGSNRSLSFSIPSGVKVYGGFAGTETVLTDRDWLSNLTVLSGNIMDQAIHTDNSYHVVSFSSAGASTVLDGFTIQRGYADGTLSPDSNGGGILLLNSSPTLENLRIQDNTSTHNGGGIYNSAGSPVLNSVILWKNAAEYGGGMHNVNAPSPFLKNVTFTQNTATMNGGGMLNLTSSPVLRDVHFGSNTAGVGGGGMSSYTTSNPKLINATFRNNTAGYYGGGLQCEEDSSVSLINATFSKNESGAYGGGMETSNACTASLVNVSFLGNTAAITGGGGLFSNATLKQVTFTDNSAENVGGLSLHNGTLTLRNSILWGNTSTLGENQISKSNTAILSIAYSLVDQATCPGTCAHVITGDPKFVDRVNGDLRLRLGSPAIDAGDNAELPYDVFDVDSDGDSSEILPVALDMRPRKWDLPQVTDTGSGTQPVVDMGAFEARLIYVDQAALGLNNGTSWTDAYTSLKTALTASLDGDEIWVAAGTYKPTTGTQASASFAIPHGVSVYGGFAGTETARSQRDWQAHLTTLSGRLGGLFRSFHVVTFVDVSRSTVVDGFTITGGNADSLIISTYHGGGISMSDSAPTLRNLIIKSNHAGPGGGGGIYSLNSEPLLINVVLTQNSSEGDGGAMYNDGCSDLMLNLINVTIAGNSAGDQGGGLYNNNCSMTARNTILWGNTAVSEPNISSNITHPPSFYHSLLEGGCLGNNTVCVYIETDDPMFADLAAGDLRLKGTSPAIDQGNNNFVPSDASDLDGDGDTSEDFPFDLAAHARFIDHPRADLGAGTAPIVDIGAYEMSNTAPVLDNTGSPALPSIDEDSTSNPGILVTELLASARGATPSPTLTSIRSKGSL